MKKRCAVIHKGESSFVKGDIDILKTKYHIRSYRFRPQDIIGLIRVLRWSDFAFVWFGSDHAVATIKINKLLGKKTIVVAGGYDAANCQDIKYGLMASPFKRGIARCAFNHADLVLAVSAKTLSEVLTECSPKRIELVYNAIVPEDFVLRGRKDKENLIVTISAINKTNIAKKGLLYFVMAAQEFPNYRFAIIGKESENFKIAMPRNCFCTGYLSDKDLKDYLSHAKVYCQLSRHESYGIAVVEAMASGCVPVITEDCGVREVIRDNAVYCEYGNLASIRKAIKIALTRSNEKNLKTYRALVEERANMKDRKERLLKLVGEVLK